MTLAFQYTNIFKKTLQMLCVNHLAEVEIKISPRLHFDFCSLPLYIYLGPKVASVRSEC